MTDKPVNSPPENMPVTFSTLILSLASAAVMAMGLEKNPVTDQFEKDLDLARFNIDMLVLLKDKTKNNLDAEEKNFLDQVASDLQMRFVQMTSGNKP
jgi:hypothetical protein